MDPAFVLKDGLHLELDPWLQSEHADPGVEAAALASGRVRVHFGHVRARLVEWHPAQQGAVGAYVHGDRRDPPPQHPASDLEVVDVGLGSRARGVEGEPQETPEIDIGGLNVRDLY
jgi:hypothetical protein